MKDIVSKTRLKYAFSYKIYNSNRDYMKQTKKGNNILNI